jgi:hypothetical protein
MLNVQKGCFLYAELIIHLFFVGFFYEFLNETRGSPRSLLSLTWIKAAFNNNATALWRPSWWESATAGHNFGRGPSNVYSIKVWF